MGHGLGGFAAGAEELATSLWHRYGRTCSIVSNDYGVIQAPDKLNKRVSGVFPRGNLPGQPPPIDSPSQHQGHD